MKYTVKEKNNWFHIVGTGYNFNNKLTAEKLCETLNEFEELKKKIIITESTLDKVESKLVNLQMTGKILDHELSELKRIFEE